MIVGTAMLDELCANIDYASRSITSVARPDIGRIYFDLKGTHKWRNDTSVTTRRDIVLLPNTLHVVEGYIEYHELRTLTIEDCKFGGVHPIQTMGDRGIEVKHTLNRLIITREAL